MTPTREPTLEAVSISKQFGEHHALRDVNLSVTPGEVTCLLGDNGAGKSTLIKILAGAERPDRGQLRVNGETVTFASPRDALDSGIATVFQDLALVGVMPVYRNFVLGREPRGRRRIRGWMDVKASKDVARQQLEKLGVHVGDVSQPVGTLSGGQRQCVAIARAIHFGARTLILDEPTSALGVREAEMVLRQVMDAKARGIAIVLITHNVYHAFPVGDTFIILRRGESAGVFRREELTVAELTRHMAGGAEIDLIEADLHLRDDACRP